MPSWGAKQMTAALLSFRLLGQRLLPVNSQAAGGVVNVQRQRAHVTTPIFYPVAEMPFG